ncbi:MAG TPA: hypothetical protein VE990_13295 [Acidimicrobiales bacterium]|nr:hypothetical protein [Acidimicrobiales bacterium]
MVLSAERRQALLQAKLTALVRQGWDDAPPEDGTLGTFPAGATLIHGDRGWVLGENPDRTVGAALAWATKAGLAELHLIVPGGAGAVARRAAQFSLPVSVWIPAGPAEPSALAPAPPEPLGPPTDTPSGFDLGRLEPVLARLGDIGLDVVVEHGLVLGEILGLELVRVEPGPEGEPVVSVGVGRHDRHARSLLDPAGLVPWEDQARQAMVEVRRRRRADGPAHPARLLSPERWLRSVLVARPDLAGALRLAPFPPPSARRDLRVPCPAPAIGVGADGAPVAVVCSSGVDLEVVPVAADVRAQAAHAGGVESVTVVLPAGDDLPAMRALAALLAEPVEVRTVPADWRRFGPAGSGGGLGTL